MDRLPLLSASSTKKRVSVSCVEIPISCRLSCTSLFDCNVHVNSAFETIPLPSASHSSKIFLMRRSTYTACFLDSWQVIFSISFTCISVFSTTKATIMFRNPKVKTIINPKKKTQNIGSSSTSGRATSSQPSNVISSNNEYMLRSTVPNRSVQPLIPV